MNRSPQRSPHATLGLVLAAVCSGCVGRDDPEERNLVLVVLDTVRADHLGVYGYDRDTSPQLDRFAAEGVVYEHTVSPAPWTVPAIGSILTSTYPSEHHAGERTSAEQSDERTGKVEFGSLARMDASLPTIASLLKAHGWATRAILANPKLPRFGLFKRGYDAVDHRPGEETGTGFRRAETITDLALTALDELGDGPFFLALHYADPHAPYDPRELVDPADVARYAERDGLSPARAKAVASYDQELREMDRELGRLFDALRARPDYADMLVVVTADHGEELWDHDDRQKQLGPTVVVPNQHGHTFFQELLRVPLVVKFPGRVWSGRRDGRVATSVDVLPTILDVVEVPAPAHLRGVSLAAREPGPLPTDPGRARHVLAEHPIFANERRVVVHGATKYVLDLETGAERFYRLAEGGASDVEVTGELEKARKQALRDLLREAPSTRGAIDAGEVVDPETLDYMRALGYVE